jgi:hypothetical protein
MKKPAKMGYINEIENVQEIPDYYFVPVGAALIQKSKHIVLL